MQRYLDAAFERTKGREDYVGEWHVHRALDAPPSCVDRRSLFRIARSTSYGTDEPVLLIAEHQASIFQLKAYVFRVRPKRGMEEVEVLRSDEV